MESPPVVVVIEDNLAMQALLVSIVRRLGLTPRSAFDSVEGIALIVAERPSAVIVDLAYPNAKGIGILRQLREAAPYCLRRTVVLTDGDSGSLAECPAELREVRGVLQKPFEVTDLEAEMMRCLGTDDSFEGLAGQDLPSLTSGALRRGEEWS